MYTGLLLMFLKVLKFVAAAMMAYRSYLAQLHIVDLYEGVNQFIPKMSKSAEQIILRTELLQNSK